jgi:hypothetical protein
LVLAVALGSVVASSCTSTSRPEADRADAAAIFGRLQHQLNAAHVSCKRVATDHSVLGVGQLSATGCDVDGKRAKGSIGIVVFDSARHATAFLRGYESVQCAAVAAGGVDGTGRSFRNGGAVIQVALPASPLPQPKSGVDRAVAAMPNFVDASGNCGSIG